MALPRYRLLAWAAVLIGLCIFANWPRDLGLLKLHLTVVGFPFIFARWDSHEIVTFSPLFLMFDLAIAVAFCAACLFFIAWAGKDGTLATGGQKGATHP